MSDKRDSFNFDYQCKKCGEVETSQTLRSFMCECGGAYRLLNGTHTDVLESYFDETLGIRITSAAQRNREFRKRGLYVSQDDTKMMKRFKDIRENKEEFHQEMMAKEGRKYKIGSGQVWDENKQDFTGGNSRTRSYFFPS